MNAIVDSRVIINPPAAWGAPCKKTSDPLGGLTYGRQERIPDGSEAAIGIVLGEAVTATIRQDHRDPALQV